MKSRRQDASEDRPITSRLAKRSKTSVNGRKNLESIPIDLVIEILSRLPATSIAACCCVLKLWASILRRPDFTEFFLTRSRARPRLLFVFHKHGELFFYSSPQLETSSPITASYHMKIPFNNDYGRVWYINGLVFLRDERVFKGRKNPSKVLVLCNPSTRQSSVLSKMKTKRRRLYSLLGYDQIEKQLKVLSMTTSTGGGPYYASAEYQVLTLGTKKMSWRKIVCRIPHYPVYDYEVVCVNGVLYYRALFLEGTMIVCFDIRSEKFRFMKAGDNITAPTLHDAKLIDYNGKLGSRVSDGYSFSSSSTSIVLWILEDIEKHEWSKHVYVIPPLLPNAVNLDILHFVGVVGGNEFVFSPISFSSSLYIIYYNIERNTIRRVEIHGLESSECETVYTFVNHIEDFRPIDGY